MLLYDLRHAALHCCIHECKPRTCHKGWLGRHGFCRLGFWHWKDVSQWTAADTWQRYHGLPLCPEPCIGEVPPLEGVLLTERHHPYHTRFHVGALGVGKCNHDINVLLKAPLLRTSAKSSHIWLPHGIDWKQGSGSWKPKNLYPI